MKIKELLTDKSKWTQGKYARNKDGKQCNPHKDDAVCWCLMGAIGKCYSDPDKIEEIHKKIRHYLKKENLPFPMVITYNDHPARKFSDIKKLVNDLDI